MPKRLITNPTSPAADHRAAFLRARARTAWRA